MFRELEKALKKLKNDEKKEVLQRFFKTGKGDYGEGDVFFGITMPEQRAVAKKYYRDIMREDIKRLLHSKIHEYRMTALVMMTYQYEKADEKKKESLYRFYLNNTRYINNWDLVDVTAPKIVGKHLLDRDRGILYKLAKSKLLWDRRIAVISTFEFIKNGSYEDCLKISKILLGDDHDLMHKAVGWMLREIGKRDMKAEEQFLKIHYKNMPRTMLRYAIEKFPEPKRQTYLKK